MWLFTFVKLSLYFSLIWIYWWFLKLVTLLLSWLTSWVLNWLYKLINVKVGFLLICILTSVVCTIIVIKIIWGWCWIITFLHRTTWCFFTQSWSASISWFRPTTMMLPASFHSLHCHLLCWFVTRLSIDLIAFDYEILLHQSTTFINKICVFADYSTLLTLLILLLILLWAFSFTRLLTHWLLLKNIVNALIVITENFYFRICRCYFVKWWFELIHCCCFAFYCDG